MESLKCNDQTISQNTKQHVEIQLIANDLKQIFNQNVIKFI